MRGVVLGITGNWPVKLLERVPMHGHTKAGRSEAVGSESAVIRTNERRLVRL